MMSPTDLSTFNFRQGIPIVVGVSGGPDSLALLHFLRPLHPNLIAATFNHQLRPEANADADFVGAFAAGLGLPFVTGSADVANFALTESLSIEAAARELRYRFLFQEARKAGAQAVAVGHTADDQAETVLMHFLRGSGISGLKGMQRSVILPIFDTEIPIVRPLLNWTRTDTENYCSQHNLQPRTDSSNADTLYFRNQLRHELLPALEKYNPKIRQTLVRTALALQGDHELLNDLVESAWISVVSGVENGSVTFDRKKLENMSPALRRNLFRKAAFLLKPGLRDVDFGALERASTLKPVDVAGGLKTLVEGGWLHLTKDESSMTSGPWPQVSEPHLINAEHTPLENGWFVEVKEKYGGELFAWACENRDPYAAWLDADLTAGRLHVRAARSGDRFEPLGMPRQTVKLANLFINLKIPKRLRKNWPLVFAGDEIAWVAGLRLSERFKVTKKTRRAVIIEIKKYIAPSQK